MSEKLGAVNGGEMRTAEQSALLQRYAEMWAGRSTVHMMVMTEFVGPELEERAKAEFEALPQQQAKLSAAGEQHPGDAEANQYDGGVDEPGGEPSAEVSSYEAAYNVAGEEQSDYPPVHVPSGDEQYASY